MHDEPRQKLRDLIIEYGPSLCEDPRRCEALLKDYCGQYKREIFVLVSALKSRVVEDLIKASAGVPLALVVERLIQRLEDELGLAENAARWAVESWALALGMPVVPTERPRPAPEPPRVKPVEPPRRPVVPPVLLSSPKSTWKKSTPDAPCSATRWIPKSGSTAPAQLSTQNEIAGMSRRTTVTSSSGKNDGQPKRKEPPRWLAVLLTTVLVIAEIAAFILVTLFTIILKVIK